MLHSYLTEVDLSYFRCFRRLQLVTDNCPVILIGPNGSGKTSILEAVSLFSPGRGLRRAKVDEMASRLGKVGWKVSCTLSQGGVERTLSSFWQNTPGRQIRIDGKSTKQDQLNYVVNILWLTPAMDRLWSEGADGRRKFLDRISMSLRPEHAIYSLTYERAMRERNRLLRERIDDANWCSVLESQMAKSGVQITKGRLHAIERINNAYADMNSVFPTAGLQLISREGAGALILDSQELADAMRSSRKKDYATGRTLVGPHRADLWVEFKTRNMAAKHCSTGEQKAMLISLVLANARAIADDFDYPPVLLLDEIVAHLDPERIKLLLTEVNELNSQIWMTGTESSLFDGLPCDVQRLQVISDINGSFVKPLA